MIYLKKKFPKKPIINKNKLISNKKFKPLICLNVRKQIKVISLWPVNLGWVQ